jgi:regulator of vacuolar morphogenesis
LHLLTLFITLLAFPFSSIMNISVPGYSETSPIYYNIEVSVERTTFNIQKRYSDFIQLCEILENEMGEQPPADLPGKKWLGNKSREFLEERRRGLEVFLRAIAKREQWRESLAMTDFLQVSKYIKRANESTVANGFWIKTMCEAQDLLRQAVRSDGAQLRKLQVMAQGKIRELEKALAYDSATGDVGEGELRRRRDALLEVQRIHREVSDSHTFGVAAGISSQPTTRTSSPRILGAGKETERTKSLNNAQLVQLQKDDMEEQDQHIRKLGEQVRRQKELGLAINGELEYQNQLLDQLDSETHVTNARLNQARRRTNKLNN